MTDINDDIFINREKEIKFLNSHFESMPNSILFVYGPKSSGKSKLLRKIANDLDKSVYAVNFISLRSVIIYNFKTFLNVFFPKAIKNKFADIASGITFNMGFFSVKTKEESILQENAFKIISDKLESANKRGIKPIIIIDEIQLLKNIYINGERYLIDELFNLFIEITKTKHLCHLVLATSDSYFIEEIYNSAKLSQTSRFFFVDHFDKKEVEFWLKKENFTDDEINTVWHYLGGSPWEIMETVIRKKMGESAEKAALDLLNDKYSKIYNFILPFAKEKKAMFFKVIKEIAEKGFCDISHLEDDNITNFFLLLKEMIAHDFWFYKTDGQKITANCKSLYWAFKKIVE